MTVGFFVKNADAESMDDKITAFASSNQSTFPIREIMLDNVSLTVKIADTQTRMEQGLQFSNPLPYDEGMLFVPQTPQVLSMWMPNMKFSLDMIWFDDNGNIQYIEKNVPPCTSLKQSTCPIYNENGPPSQYVLEVTSGFVDKYNISMNSKLALPVPEFDSTVGGIIAISLIGVLIISRKSGFSFLNNNI